MKLVASGSEASRSRGGTDPQAYALYLKGRYHAGKLTPDGLKRSIDYFQQALADKPDEPRVWAGFARIYAMLGFLAYAPPGEAFSKAKLAAEKALARDESLSEAHIALGMVRFLYDWDWPGAEQAYKRAIELSPGDADAHLFYGILLKALAENDTAVAEIRRANELDPLNLMANAEIGWVAYYGGRIDEAAQACGRTLEMDPNYMFALFCRQMALTLKKDPEAIVVGKKLLQSHQKIRTSWLCSVGPTACWVTWRRRGEHWRSWASDREPPPFPRPPCTTSTWGSETETRPSRTWRSLSRAVVRHGVDQERAGVRLASIRPALPRRSCGG